MNAAPYSAPVLSIDGVPVSWVTGIVAFEMEALGICGLACRRAAVMVWGLTLCLAERNKFNGADISQDACGYLWKTSRT